MVTFSTLHSGKEVTRLLYAVLLLISFHDSFLWKPLSTSCAFCHATGMWKHVRSAMEKGDLLAFSNSSPTELCRDTSDRITLMDFDSWAVMMFLKKIVLHHKHWKWTTTTTKKCLKLAKLTRICAKFRCIHLREEDGHDFGYQCMLTQIYFTSLLVPRTLKMNYNTSVYLAALLFVTTESKASNAHLAFSHMP